MDDLPLPLSGLDEDDVEETQQGITGLEGHNKVLESASSLLWFFTGITGLLTNPS
jgi:hypothetical protein